MLKKAIRKYEVIKIGIDTKILAKKTYFGFKALNKYNSAGIKKKFMNSPIANNITTFQYSEYWEKSADKIGFAKTLTETR